MASIEKSTRRIASLYRESQREIIKELRGATDFRRAMLLEVQEQIKQELNRLGAKTEEVLTEEVERHYVDGAERANKAFQSKNIPINTGFTQIDTEAMKVMADEAFTSFGQSLTTAERSTSRVISKVRRKRIRSILFEGRVTGKTRREITETIKAELSDGITALVDKRGKEWSLDTYSEMLTRTKMREATNEGLVNRLSENGVDLVQVSNHNSDHNDCAVWEGVILSISGESTEHESVEEATDAGLFHPNCKHRLLPYRKAIAELAETPSEKKRRIKMEESRKSSTKKARDEKAKKKK